MGRLYLVKLDGEIYSCRFCRSHLTNNEELVSKEFHCRRGKAYLFDTVVNVFSGPTEERLMTSGMHTVSDIYCCCCHQIVGWKYERAYEKKQKFKEGKFILELASVAGGDSNEFYSEGNPTSADAHNA